MPSGQMAEGAVNQWPELATSKAGQALAALQLRNVRLFPTLSVLLL